jgi:predicted signal transduction protein with EAL and GGDEF domain
VTASFGVAQHRPGAPVTELLAAADAGLYQAKHAGRDAVRGVGAPHLPPVQRSRRLWLGIEKG